MESERSEDQEVLIIPEEAIKYLPKEWQQSLRALKEDGQGILAAADENLKILNRLIHAFPTMVSLRYIHDRLASTKFEPSMEWALENDMLILAFVTTYVRLIDGGIGSGVSRGALPAELRMVHDNIVELRNMRYAHNAGHHSTDGLLSIGFTSEKFDIGVTYNMGFHVGGANEWKRLVEFLDALMLDRLHAQLEKLKEKTGREWTFPSGPAPSWIRVKSNE
jgi:hypothetical protein